ncbi:MAG: hypothetical protein R3B70_10335 [Polyangiaceae bacterium]
MDRWTMSYGAALTALGVGGYLATGRESKTALIPAGFGGAALAIGVLSPGRAGRMAAAVLAVGAVAGAARGVAKLPALVRGEPVERPAAVIAQSVMVGVSVGYLIGLAAGVRR